MTLGVKSALDSCSEFIRVKSRLDPKRKSRLDPKRLDDLKKKRSGNDSFWLIGQPDVEIKAIAKGEDKGKYQVEVLGFDYCNPKTGNVHSGGKGNIAMGTAGRP